MSRFADYMSALKRDDLNFFYRYHPECRGHHVKYSEEILGIFCWREWRKH